MFTVTVETGFRAEHQLVMHDGQKEPLHGHDWLVRASVCGDRLDRLGLLVDFNWLTQILKGAFAPLEGEILEQAGCFNGTSASAENVARYVFQAIEPQMPDNVRLLWVEVTEKQGCCARYTTE